MLSFLLPFASKIVSDAVSKIPDDAELGEKLIDLCLVILKKAVKLTKTDMDDKLLEQVEKAIKTRYKGLFKKDLKGTVLGMNEAVVNGTTESGVPADQRLVGTDSLRKYTENLVPGSTWGKQFINKYRKK